MIWFFVASSVFSVLFAKLTAQTEKTMKKQFDHWFFEQSIKFCISIKNSFVYDFIRIFFHSHFHHSHKIKCIFIRSFAMYLIAVFHNKQIIEIAFIMNNFIRSSFFFSFLSFSSISSDFAFFSFVHHVESMTFNFSSSFSFSSAFNFSLKSTMIFIPANSSRSIVTRRSIVTNDFIESSFSFSFLRFSSFVRNFAFLSFVFIIDSMTSDFSTSFDSSSSFISLLRFTTTLNIENSKSRRKIKNFAMIFNIKNSKWRRIIRNSFVIDKTKNVQKLLKRLNLSFDFFVEKSIKFHHFKARLTKKFDLLRSIFFDQMFIVLKTIDWKHDIYRYELTQMTKSEHFEFWKIKNSRHFAVKTELVIQNMNDRVSHLMSFFRVIARSVDARSNRSKKQNHNRWIAIMTNFLYIFMFRSCIFWSTMWSIQLHVNDIKRRVIENLFHTKLCIKYKAILKTFQQLFAH